MPKATVRANARTVPKTNRDAAVGAAAAGLPDEPMSAEQLAAFDFEPLTRTEDEWKPPADKEWMDDGRYVLRFVRMAWRALHLTKAELVEGFGKLDEEPFEVMMDGIAHSHEFLGSFVKISKAGEVRLLCAASAAALRAGNEETRS